MRRNMRRLRDKLASPQPCNHCRKSRDYRSNISHGLASNASVSSMRRNSTAC
jgi:hypothetical protein